MQDQIKILCAELLNLKDKKEVHAKYTKKGLCSIISKTSRICLPDPEELEELQILLMEESELIKESLKKLESLNEIVLKTGMNQMVMNLKEKE